MSNGGSASSSSSSSSFVSTAMSSAASSDLTESIPAKVRQFILLLNPSLEPDCQLPLFTLSQEDRLRHIDTVQQQLVKKLHWPRKLVLEYTAAAEDKAQHDHNWLRLLRSVFSLGEDSGCVFPYEPFIRCLADHAVGQLKNKEGVLIDPSALTTEQLEDKSREAKLFVTTLMLNLTAEMRLQPQADVDEMAGADFDKMLETSFVVLLCEAAVNDEMDDARVASMLHTLEHIRPHDPLNTPDLFPEHMTRNERIMQLVALAVRFNHEEKNEKDIKQWLLLCIAICKAYTCIPSSAELGLIDKRKGESHD